MGDKKTALKFYEEAHDFIEVGLKNKRKWRYLNNLGQVYSELGLGETSGEVFARSSENISRYSR